MTIVTVREELDDGSPGGCRVRGPAREVIAPGSSGTTANALLVGQSGALCLFDNAAGNIYTLPAISAQDIGMWFEFQVTVTRTSNSHSIDTDAATTFIGGGGILAMSTTPGESDAFVPATTDVSIDLDVATTGEQAGGNLVLTATTVTNWNISGYTVGVGTATTPFV